ncbi:COP9 signalosome complex subunit 8-like [Lepus europaeus]|uniref:COP9 signalosome complex subunit 8-like n=1 Tax=Lepus europaeus TaxID=9983 RepID=UPI002B479A55|nr:COP9 signalosome complex subunit 8-like [Lepus europaeus]
MNSARHLWERIPPAIQSANSERGGIWSSRRKNSAEAFPWDLSNHQAYQGSELVQPITEALGDALRRQAFTLVSQAYTSITAKDCTLVGLSVGAVKGISEQWWLHRADSATRTVLPRKPAAGAPDVSFNRLILLSEPAPAPPVPNEQRVARLTDVAILEN